MMLGESLMHHLCMRLHVQSVSQIDVALQGYWLTVISPEVLLQVAAALERSQAHPRRQALAAETEDVSSGFAFDWEGVKQTKFIEDGWRLIAFGLEIRRST